MEVLKVEVLDIGSKPFTQGEETGSRDFFPIVCYYDSSGVDSKSVSQPFQPVLKWVFPHSSNV